MGEGGGGEEKEKEKGFSSSPLSLFGFHLSPFPPETPDTQAKRESAFEQVAMVMHGARTVF